MSSSMAGTGRYQYKPWQVPPRPEIGSSPWQASVSPMICRRVRGGSSRSRLTATFALTPAHCAMRCNQRRSCLIMSASQRTRPLGPSRLAPSGPWGA